MSRQARVDIENAWYHVIARGQRRQDIFKTDADRRTYLGILGRALGRRQGNIGAYCLMSNHVHLILKRGHQPLGRIIRDAHGHYARYFNRQHGHVGYVFQGRFKSFLVLEDSYLSTVLRYIHENPVRAKMCRRPQEYRWSTDSHYRKGTLPRMVCFRWLPGFDDSQNRSAYKILMASDSEAMPVFMQYIGRKDELPKRNRRTRSRTINEERRGRTPLRIRLSAMLRRHRMELRVLRSRLRTRKISSARQRIMAELYAEGHAPADIAKSLNKTPSAVIRASERSR